MSTKCSIAHGADFHLYSDSFDEEHVFLELDNVGYKVTPGCVTVEIPLHVWEYLRSFPGADLSAAMLSDAQILQDAEDAVDERLAKAASDGKDAQLALARLGGEFLMGSIDLPRDQQVAKYVAYRNRQRERQKAVLARIEALKIIRAG